MVITILLVAAICLIAAGTLMEERWPAGPWDSEPVDKMQWVDPADERGDRRRDD